jgi:hypothetical protein
LTNLLKCARTFKGLTCRNILPIPINKPLRSNDYIVVEGVGRRYRGIPPIDIAQNVLAREAPTAAFKIIEVLKSDKPVPQANYKLQAAQTILDRVGVSKTDRIDVNHNTSGGIFILPEKKAIDIVAEDADYEEL